MFLFIVNERHLFHDATVHFLFFLDDDIHNQVLIVLRDTVFRWFHCNIEKYIDRYESPSLFILNLKKRSSMKAWILVNSGSLITRIQCRRFAIVIVMSRTIYVIYIYICRGEYKSFSWFIKQRYAIKIWHFRKHYLQIISELNFQKIDDRSKLFSRTLTCSSSSRKCPLSFSICTFL